MVGIRSLLDGLIAASEKAARITRIIRGAYWALDDGPIATEEKVPRWDGGEDYKTLADVLCQAVIERELRKRFAELKDIHGEENGSFETGEADSVHVQIKDTVAETSAMLAKALSNAEVVNTLSELIHSDEQVPSFISDELSVYDSEFQGAQVDLSTIGVWIDPIDATNEYVKAKKTRIDEGVCFSGLPTVTVIIGAYNTTNGQPVAGVISRPFNDVHNAARDFTGCKTRIYWGCWCPDSRVAVMNPSCKRTDSTRTKLLISTSSGERMRFLHNHPQYQLMAPRGAGNKMLTVINGLADLYLITTESNVVFRWDVCAGHAILKAQGGGVLSYRHTLEAIKTFEYPLEKFPFADYEIDYRGSHDPLVDGIIAYSNVKHVIRLFSDLLQHLKR